MAGLPPNDNQEDKETRMKIIWVNSFGVGKIYLNTTEIQLLDEILLIAARSDEINTEQANLINELQEKILEVLG